MKVPLPRQIAYIVGCGHSGSTLLSMVLGSSSGSFSAGELKFLQDYVSKPEPDHFLPGSPCTCGAGHITRCPVWQQVFSSFEKKSGREIACYPARVGRMEAISYLLGIGNKQAMSLDTVLFESITEASHSNCVVDASKSVNRLIRLMSGEHTVRVIHLVRDVRGFANSQSRQGTPIWKSYLAWTINNLSVLFLRVMTCRHRRISWIQVSYDRFACQPADELKRLSDFLGLEYSDRLLHYWAQVHHNIGGNPMRIRKRQITYDGSPRLPRGYLIRLLHAMVSPLNRVLVGSW